jgi:hypothetical protein
MWLLVVLEVLTKAAMISRLPGWSEPKMLAGVAASVTVRGVVRPAYR